MASGVGREGYRLNLMIMKRRKMCVRVVGPDRRGLEKAGRCQGTLLCALLGTTS